LGNCGPFNSSWYTVEIFGDVLPGLRSGRYLSALKKLQQVLGAAHDAIVAVDRVTTLEKSEGKFVKPAASLIRNWALACHKRNRKKLVALWRRLEKSDFREPRIIAADRQAPRIYPRMIPLCSRFDSVLFTPKRSAIATFGYFSRSLLININTRPAHLMGGIAPLFPESARFDGPSDAPSPN
jgi:hypothetical protein